MSAAPPVRVAHLSGYLSELIRDIRAQGKIAKIEGNPVEVAAVAIMSGSGAVIEALWSDIVLLAGNAKTHAKVVARPALEQLIARGASSLADKLVSKFLK